MANPKKPLSLMGAAECARRTGLTVRALRVYERHGLIEPARSGNGWRLYGPKELQRLNVVVTLKALGMKLEQIRALMQTTPPSLAKVLELQLQACRDRRAEADKAIGLVQAALLTVRSGKPLSLEDLCDLTRSMEMESQHARFQVVRELINERITPDEERAVMTWIASRPPDQMKLIHESAPALRDVYQSLQALLEQKVGPAAPETQALIVQWNELVVRSGLRDLNGAMFEWNTPLAQKWTQMGERAISRMMCSQTKPTDQDLMEYIRAAQAASPWGLAIEPIVDEAAELAGNEVQPSLTSAQVLVDRLERICADHSLGTPLLFARWARGMQLRVFPEDTRKQAAWTFLTAAIQAGSAAPGAA